MKNEGSRNLPLRAVFALKKGCSRCAMFDPIRDSNFGYCREPDRRKHFADKLCQEARVNEFYVCAGFTRREPREEDCFT